MPLKLILWIVLGLALAISVITDLLGRRIFDLVTLPAIAVSLGLRAWAEGLGDPEHGLVSGLIGLAGAGALFAVLAAWKKSFGWGDVKLVAGVGAALGYPLVLAALAFISLSGALQAIVTLIWQGAVWDTVRQMLERLGRKLKLSQAQPSATPRHIPYGVAIALGSVWAMWWDGAGGTH